MRAASPIKRWHRWLRQAEDDALTQEIRRYLEEADAQNTFYEGVTNGKGIAHSDGVIDGDDLPDREGVTAEDDLPDREGATAGDDLILVGKLGLAGTYLLGSYAREGLAERLPNWFIDDALSLAQASHRYLSPDWLKAQDIHAVYTVGEGGLYRSLYQLGKDSGLGYRVSYPSRAISQYTVEFCEIYDMDPLKLFACGCQLLVAPRRARVLRSLQRMGISDCICIGQMTAEKTKVLVHREFESLVNRPDPDELLTFLLHRL